LRQLSALIVATLGLAAILGLSSALPVTAKPGGAAPTASSSASPPPPSTATAKPNSSSDGSPALDAQLSETPANVNVRVVGVGQALGRQGSDGGSLDGVPGDAPTRECAGIVSPVPGAAGADGGSLPPTLTTADIHWFLPPSKVPGQLYVLYCTTDGVTWVLSGGFVFQPGQPADVAAVPVVAPQALALRALANVHVPAPRIGTAPPYRNDTLVGIDTWSWVDPAQWHELSATAAVGSLSVTAVVKPVRVTWDMGEGHHTRPTVCHSAGTVYNRHVADDLQHTQCAYVFQWASWDHRSDLPGADADDLYHARATVSWQVNWVASDGEFGSLADLSSATPFDLRVEDLQAVVCENTPLGQCHPPPSTAPH